MNWQELKWKIKSISFIGKTYDMIIGNRKVDRIERAKREALHSMGYDLAEKIDRELSKCDVMFFMDFGTLLGIVRSGKFIGHDCDMDYGLYLTEKFTWEDLQTVMCSIGLEKAGQHRIGDTIVEQTYARGELTVDFFSHFNDGANNFVYGFFKKEGKKYFSSHERSVGEMKIHSVLETKEINIDGRKFTIPSESEKYLESIYTSTWRMPNPNWKDEDSPAWRERTDLIGFHDE